MQMMWDSRSENINIGSLCTEFQILRGNRSKPAMIWRDRDDRRLLMTFEDLNVRSNLAAGVFRDLGLSEGERLFIYLPKDPEIYTCLLGGLKNRLITCCLFYNFGPDALMDRLSDAQATCIVTRQSALRKLTPLLAGLPSVRFVLVVDMAEHLSNQVLSFQKLRASASGLFSTPHTDPDTPSIVHYTSGSTGKPKGALHVHRSVYLQAWTARHVLGLRDDDIFWCTADPGWVTGVSYGVIGPWSQGVTQVHYGGPYDAAEWLKVLQDEKVTVWYTAPTALRMLRLEEPELFGRYDLSRLRCIFSVGEPLNPEIIHWGADALGKQIYDTWFQTETGSIMISNRPERPVKPGSMGTPVEGIQAIVCKDDGSRCLPMERGHLCLVPGWDSMFVDYLNHNESYKEKFRFGTYFTGDTAFVDEEGYFWFAGRSDDIINTSGHLVSPFEVESCLLELPAIGEAGVIGVPDDMLHEKVVAFIVLKHGFAWSEELELKIRVRVSNRVSTVAAPRDIRVVETLPKTRSGKIMRRILKARYLGQDVGDLSAMET
jgi:acetyl-CoA synthetase